jgi:hypothetical protein
MTTIDRAGRLPGRERLTADGQQNGGTSGRRETSCGELRELT